MADTTIQKQGEVFISQSEYDALRLAGNLQSNTKYHITKTPKTGVDSLEQMNLLNGDKTVTYDTTNGMTVNGTARFTYTDGNHDATMGIEVPIVAGEGIVIDKKASEEKVEVKLDTDLTDGKYVAKIGKVNYNGLYGRLSNGTDWFAPFSENPELVGGNWTIAQRYTDGRLKVGTAVADSDAMTKKQVEDGFVPKTTTAWRIYATNGQGNQGLLNYTAELGGNALIQRDSSGRAKIQTPTDAMHIANKKYVDDGFVAKRTTTNELRVYAYDSTGDTSAYVYYNIAQPWSIVQRDSSGCVKVADPEGQNDATTKKYVDDGFVPKRTTTGGVYLYAYDSTGDISQSADTGPNGYTVARRDAGGVLKVGDPVGQNDATNKKYVDDGFVKKITSSSNQAYTTGPNGDSSIPVIYSIAQPWSIVSRDGSGHVRTADPEGQNDAVTKSYADNRFRYTHHILINEATSGFSASLTFASSSNTEIGGLGELPTTFMAANGIFNNGGHYYQIIGIQGSTDLAVQVYYINSDDSYGLAIAQHDFGGEQQLTDTVY